jgi:hypothetical protein
MELSLDHWIDYCAKLTPYENFLLIGLLFSRPSLQQSIFAASLLSDVNNARAAEKWSESHFRRLLLLYCANYKKRKTEALLTLAEKVDVIKLLLPALVSAAYALPLGIAVGFLFWAVSTALDDWCKKYSERKYNGTGRYAGNFPEKEVESFFELSYLPPIEEYIEDPAAYPLEGYKINIRVDSASEGRLKLGKAEDLLSITFHFTAGSHSFVFTDTRQKEKVSGEVDNVSHIKEDGPNVLRFTSAHTRVEPSFLP